MSDIDYYLRYTFLVLLLGYHLMELDMIKIAFPGILEEYELVKHGNKKESLTKFSEMYSFTLYVGIPSTIFWGWASDKFGCFKTSLIHLIIHIGLTGMLAYTQTYQSYTVLYVIQSFFSNYTISLNTFMGWIPQDRKQSFVAKSQFYSSSMLQVAPLIAGYLLLLSGKDLIFNYHMFLAAIHAFFTAGYAYAFRNYTEEVKMETIKQSAESEDLKGLHGYIVILKSKTGASLTLFGIYLRLVKKLVDVAVHLWAEIGINENGLGFDKSTLGTYSSIGGILSVILYLYFSTDDVSKMPKQLSNNLLLCAVCIFCLPFLAVVPPAFLNPLLVLLILVFNFCFSALFAVWIGLLNTGVRREIRSKSFAITLAIRSVIGSYISTWSFELLKWALHSPEVTSYLGGKLNSGVFFWLFTGVNLVMYAYFRNLKVVKKEKEWELHF